MADFRPVLGSGAQQLGVSSLPSIAGTAAASSDAAVASAHASDLPYELRAV